MNKITIIITLILCVIHSLFSQPVFRITLLEGTAKIQRSEKKIWDNLETGNKINDNDIIETFFKTKMIMQYGTENAIIMGSNSKALFNIKGDVQEDTVKYDVNITLFSGGVLTKAKENSLVTIYTSNAVAQTGSGTISSVVEAGTGNTGFQILSGSAHVRNITQQQGKDLNLGLTTIVLPGKEPTAPLFITYRHVSVLKHFFSDELINSEIETSGITPTEDKGGTSRLSFSRSLREDEANIEVRMYKRLFSPDKIYGIILDDRVRKRKTYKHNKKPKHPFDNRGELEFNSSLGIAGGNFYPKFSIIPSLHFPRFSFGLRVPLAKNAEDAMSMNFKSAEGYLDKIEHLRVEIVENLFNLEFGTVNNYTIAEGLIVSNYRNKNIYTVTQPLGVTLDIKNDWLDLNSFISDVTTFNIGGIHFGLYPGEAWLGFGYYYDTDQYKNGLTSKTSRFIAIDTIENADIIQPDPDSEKSNSHILEMNFGLLHGMSEDISIDLLFQFASKMVKGGIDGYLFRGPELGMGIDNYYFGISYIAESGKLLAGHFSSIYISNRLRVDSVVNDTVYYETQNSQLSEDRKSYGFDLLFRMSPFKGASIDFSFRHDFLTRDAFVYYDKVNESYETDTTSENINFGYALSFTINKDLFAPIQYAEIYINQIHGGYYPRSATYFTSWGFNAGFEILTSPLFLNLAFEAGLDYTYIDLYDEDSNYGFTNNNIDSGDNLIEFYIGIRWGFL